MGSTSGSGSFVNASCGKSSRSLGRSSVRHMQRRRHHAPDRWRAKTVLEFAPVAIAAIGSCRCRSWPGLWSSKCSGRTAAKPCGASTMSTPPPISTWRIGTRSCGAVPSSSIRIPKCRLRCATARRTIGGSLIAIADSFGPHWGAAARDAAVALLDGDSDEDVGVTLLTDIRDVFDDLHSDRVPGAELIRRLVDLEDARWGEFRGPHDRRRALTAGRLASMLRPFGIRPRSIWPPGPRDGGKSQKGYLRAQFEAAWSRYCPKAGTTAQPKNIRRLRGNLTGTRPARRRAEPCTWRAR